MSEERTPRVWIGCLAAYNAGRLHGEWHDVPDTAEELWELIDGVLKKSPSPGAEEWFFADNEGFHPYQPGEFPSVDTLVIAARLIREHGEAAAVWLANDETQATRADDYEELDEAFTEAYMGEWDSPAEYARSYVEDCGLPGVGFLWPEQSPFSSERPNWSDVLDELDSILDWDAIASQLTDGDLWNDGNYWFRSV